MNRWFESLAGGFTRWLNRSLCSALDEVVRTANPSTVVGVVRALQLELKDTKGSQKVNRTPADVESVLVLRCGISACAECGVGYLYCQSA